jgi:hypothetical protein
LHAGEKLAGKLQRFLAGKPQIDFRDFCNLPPDGDNGIERAAGILEDEADILSVARKMCESRPLDNAFDQGLVRQQPGNRQRQRALSRAAFADDGDALARAERQVDAAQRFCFRRPRAIADSQRRDIQQRFQERLLRAAEASTTPSPAR